MLKEAKPRRPHKAAAITKQKSEGASASPSLGPSKSTPMLTAQGSKQSSSTDALLRRAGDLFGQAAAAMYLAVFKVVMYCYRSDPVPALVDMAKALLGYDSVSMLAVPCSRTTKGLAITETVFVQETEMLSRLYRWSSWRLHSAIPPEFDLMSDVLSRRNLVRARQYRDMQHGIRSATILAASSLHNPGAVLQAAACLALHAPESVNGMTKRGGSLGSLGLAPSAAPQADHRVPVLPSPLMGALRAPFSPAPAPLAYGSLLSLDSTSPEPHPIMQLQDSSRTLTYPAASPAFEFADADNDGDGAAATAAGGAMGSQVQSSPMVRRFCS